jgi:hypothetical protein
LFLAFALVALVLAATGLCAQLTRDHVSREFVSWYCSQPRLAFNRTSCFDIAFTSNNADTRRPRSISGLAAVRRIAYEAADAGLLSPEPAAGRTIARSLHPGASSR